MLREDATGARADKNQGHRSSLAEDFRPRLGWPEQDEIELMVAVGCVRSDRIRVAEPVKHSYDEILTNVAGCGSCDHNGTV